MTEQLSNPLLPWFVTDPRVLEEYARPTSPYVVLDYETTNKEYGSALNPDNHIVLACWYVVDPDGSITKKSAWGDEYSQHDLERDINIASFFVAQNAKFELQWLRRMGMELRDILVFDTMLAEWVLAGNRNWPLNLEAMAGRYKLGSKMNLASLAIKGGMPTELIPKKWLEPYCFQDVELTHQLYLKQRVLLEDQGLMHIAHTRNLCCSVLADIEFNGCHLDGDMVKEEWSKAVEEFVSLEDTLSEITGGINLSSNKQLATYLYDTLKFKYPRDFRGNVITTPGGAPSTTAPTLLMLRATTDEQETFLSLYKRRNKLDSLLSKNLQFFKDIVDQRDGVFYGNFNQGSTQTHRLSASGRPVLFEGAKKAKGAQLQNLPRQYKSLFTSHNDDEVVVEVDGAQLEFRVAAQAGHDPVATQEIIDGADIHSNTAKVFTDAGEPTTRQQAKAKSFAPLYGGSGNSPAGREYAEFFKNKYAGIHKTQVNWTHEVLNTNQLRLPWGMRFYWPNTRVNKKGYISNTTSIFNYPIQSLATGEIVPLALVYFWHNTRNIRAYIFNTVHDSIASRVHKDDVEEVLRIGKEALTTDVYKHLESFYNYEFTVPLGIGAKVATHWGATKQEHLWSVWPSGEETYQLKE